MVGTTWRLLRLFVAGLVFAWAVAGCSDDSSDDTGGTGGTAGTAGSDGTGGTAGNGGGSGGMGGSVSPSQDAALCALIPTPTGASGFVRVVPAAAVDAGGEIDVSEGAIEVGAGVACAVWKSAVFVARVESPTMTRYDVVDGELVEGATVSFMGFGLTSLGALSGQIQIFTDDKAYFFDPIFGQIIVWNPTTMTTVEAIELTGFDPPDGLGLSRIRSGRIGDRLFLWANYVNEQGFNVARSVFAFVDPVTDEFTTDTIETCGGFLSATVTTDNGDTYFGSTAGDAINHALGFEGTFPPCAVRVREGATEVDDTFVADLNQLTGVGPSAGPFVGVGNLGFLLAYDETAMPVDPLLTSFEHTALDNWRFYAVELGSTTPATLVEDLPIGQGIGGSAVFDGRGFLIRFARDFSSTSWFDVSDTPIVETYRFGGAVQLFERFGEP